MPLATKLRMATISSSPSAEWWEVPGKTCEGVWKAVGAASLPDSKLDLSGNSKNAYTGNNPTWSSANGWDFNGTSDWLKTGLTAEPGWTIFIKYSNASNMTVNRALMGTTDSSGGQTRNFAIYANQATSENVYYRYGDLNYAYTGTRPTAAVAVLAGPDAYLNGTWVGDTGGSWTGTLSAEIIIGARYHYLNVATAVNFYDGYVQLAGAYSDTLTSTEVSDLTDRINAL